MDVMNIKEILSTFDCVVIFDTNVYLNIYRYSPEFTDFALKCIDEIKGNVIVPATVDMEYRKHRKSEYFAMKKRVQKASENIKSQVESSTKKIKNSCELLKSMQYPDIDELSKSLNLKLIELENEVEKFFEDRSVLDQIADYWNGKDLVNELFKEIIKNGSMDPFSQEELYAICEEGEGRYEKQIPPGFKDAKNKDGIRKYSDLIIWKEIIKYAKENKVNVIFVTDDAKADWWEENNIFHSMLIEEFERETGKIIHPYMSVSFYSKVSEDFGIRKTDAIEIALRLTDSDYFDRVEEKVFDKILGDIVWSRDSLIDTYSSHIGTEGIDELDVISNEFVEAHQIERHNSEIVYQFKYTVEAEGISYDYWGRDDDTKELILSPGAYHRFMGTILVNVTRELETFIDYGEDSDFETVEIVSGDLKEIEYENYSTDESDAPEGYTYCPHCGNPMNFENDAGTGFCVECEREK